MLVILGDGQDIRLGVRGNVILQKDVLAERRVTILQICFVIPRIDDGLKILHRQAEHSALVFL